MKLKMAFLIIWIIIFGFTIKVYPQQKETNVTTTDSLQNNKDVNIKLKEFYKVEYLNKVLKNKHHNFHPKEGAIPDSITAIKIAIIILTNVYGEKVVSEEKPFTALLNNGYWIIYGYIPEDYSGGVAEIVIKKDNGEIISISHGK